MNTLILNVLASIFIILLIICGVTILLIAYHCQERDKKINTSSLTESDIKKFKEYSKSFDYKDIG